MNRFTVKPSYGIYKDGNYLFSVNDENDAYCLMANANYNGFIERPKSSKPATAEFFDLTPLEPSYVGGMQLEPDSVSEVTAELYHKTKAEIPCCTLDWA